MIGLMTGANLAYLTRQPGHSLQVFFDIYADWINSSNNDREMEKVETSLRQSAPDVPQKLKLTG